MSAPKTNRIKFDLNPEQIHQLTKEIIEASTKIQDAVAAIPDGEHTFENTVLALADDDCEVSTLSSMVDFPQYVSTIPEIRDASSAASTELQKFQVESNMRRDVYKSLLKFRDSPHPELTPLQQRLFDRTLRDFKRNGLDLPDDKYDRLKEINKEISELGIKFQKNLNEENTKLEFTREELEGLPDDFFSGRETTPEGKFVVTLKYPDLLPIVQLAKRPETRKRINDVNALKLNEENTPLLERTLKLRREAAHLLGYPNHASYILEIRMAKSPELVKPFLADLSEKLDSAAHKELAVLQGLKEKELQELGREGESKEIFGHDFRYYHDKNLRDNYQVDDQAIKKYFPLDVVTKGMLSVYEDILSLRFEEIENPHVWFEEVKMFAVHDAETNEFMGHFYLDLFPRQGKYGHAAAFPLQPRHINRKTGEVQFPVAAMVANFSKPTPDKPSLLLFDEVVTFFHEFGHIMHGMCTRAEYSRFSGTSVERDFVEAPSQMLENWCYEPDVLRRISGHYEDHSKTLPEEMLQPLVRAKNADTGLLNRRQIFFGTFDQIVHSSEEDVDTGALWRQLRKEITLIPEAENANPAASFGHIMGGYDSQYYGYLFSEVFSADMYEKFKKEGVLSKQLGRLYRDVILAPGGSVDSMESLVKFLGREPTQDAFLRHIGIAPEQA